MREQPAEGKVRELRGEGRRSQGGVEEGEGEPKVYHGKHRGSFA